MLTRSSFRNGLLVSVVTALLIYCGLPVLAQAPPAQSGTITGVVLDAQQHPAADAQVSVIGQVTRHANTDANGKFSIANLPAGVYSVDVIKAGFTPLTENNVVVPFGGVVSTNIQLQAAQFSSIREIGHVSVTANAASGAAFNSSTAAVSAIPASTFIQQGQLTVNTILDEIPGVSIGLGDAFSDNGIANGADPLVTGIPSIRGALPYETASLIDGHPISIGRFGTFDPSIISPYMLQDVEVVKGPGAAADNINYAIGGTVNFRTLEPTIKNQVSVDAGIDQFGGQSANFRFTGSQGKLSYAFDYATVGTAGFDRGYNPLYPIENPAATLFNGQPACGNPAALASGACYNTVVPVPTNFEAASNLTTPVMMCCPNIPMYSNTRHELLKLRYTFTPTTALTVSYMGGQNHGAWNGAELRLFPSYFFGPPAGYSSSVYPSGTPTFQDGQGPGLLTNNSNLFQADMRTVVGGVTLIARYYASGDHADTYFGEGPGVPYSYTGALYGGVPLNNDLTPTIFTGQISTVTLANCYYDTNTTDALQGYTVEADKAIGNNYLTLSYDHLNTRSTAYCFYGSQIPLVFPGSGQSFQTVRLSDQMQFGEDISATLSDYAISYTDRYTQDGGASFLTSTHAYDAPRLAISWRPNVATAVRVSAGYSIAPPYIELLTNTLAPLPDRTPPTYFSQTANAGDVAPESSFGFDVGADRRIGNSTVVSGDLYQTTLHNQFLTTTTLSGTFLGVVGNPYFATPGVAYPLYTTATQNLGHSRYEGIELSVHRAPPVGAGYIFQGYLQRAYVYDLPNGFYDTASGVNTTNLGILPCENFQTTGQGYNGMSSSPVPYSGGYAELNYRFHNRAYFLIGVTYFGPNNGYSEPAFGVVNTSLTEPISRYTSVQLAVSNLTGAYSAFQFNIYGGIPTPLVNGNLGYTAANVIGPTNFSILLHFEGH